MRYLLLAIVSLVLFTQCTTKEQQNSKIDNEMIISETIVDQVVTDLVAKHGDKSKERITKGVNQIAGLWRVSDGKEDEFKEFCLKSFVSDEEELMLLFEKLSRNYEILWGTFNHMNVALKEPLHLSGPEISEIDVKFGGYSPSSHLTEDFYSNKIAFMVALNFPFYTLDEKTQMGPEWSNLEWAYARMGDLYTSRVPAELLQKVSESMTNSDTYISEYNICMGYLLNKNGDQLFDKDLKLITHWGLRDELKSNYAGENGLEKQQMIYEVMLRIIDQSIPNEIINSSDYTWNPNENKVFKNGIEFEYKSEPDTRYQHMLNNFYAMKAIDAYNAHYPTYISRKFDGEMELTQADVEALFIDFVSSPVLKEVGELIRTRLGRDLQPFDIWYDGFKARSSINEEELNKIVSEKYPDKESFQKDLPNMLGKLEFTPDLANFITSKISVDPSRGAGHAWGAEMRTDVSHLRTRIEASGMNYKGYNIAVHEFGHNVEQTITLQDVGHYMLHGVPNTAFTEALAFIFQKRDLMLLGIEEENKQKEHLEALDVTWGTFEIMGVSLVDMNVWKWLYENPNATAAELKVAVIDIAVEVWNKYFAPVFGVKDSPILAIYSHMIDYPLYLSAYPLGHLIDFQIEKQIKGKNFAEEVYRIYTQGRIVPQLWMKNAVGNEISGQPMLEAAEKAVGVLGE